MFARPFVWHICVIALICLSLPFLAAPVLAQDIVTAQLRGTVHDPSGAVISEALITVTDSSRGIARSTTSDAEGNYQLLFLPPGRYSATVSSKGFTKFISSNIELTIGQQANLAIILSISNNESITVTTGSSLIETQGSSQSTTVNELRIGNLPTNG